MAGIFINYRTGDGDHAAALIDRVLTEEFGESKVFRDSRALEPGVHFPSELWRRFELSTVLLVLIGSRWLTVHDEHGAARIGDPEDYVRREIRAALRRRMLLIPVLLDQSALPAKNRLPADLAELAERQYLTLRSRYSESDVRLLVEALSEHVPRVSRRASDRQLMSSTTTAAGGPPAGADRCDPNERWRSGRALIHSGRFDEAAGHLCGRLADPNAGPEVHYYLALALLGSGAPSDHLDVSTIVEHLGQAASLPAARLLWLIVDEDRRVGTGDERPPNALALSLIDRVPPDQAREVVDQFRATRSPTWRALARRAVAG